MNLIQQWAKQHDVSDNALAELITVLSDPLVDINSLTSNEAQTSNAVRVLASSYGWRLWRNNVGAGKMTDGRFLRWGLANETAAMNQKTKSADLIGIRPVLIQPKHLNTVIGQFVSVEVKRQDWKYTGTQHEQAQMHWLMLVNNLGGHAVISTGGLSNEY